MNCQEIKDKLPLFRDGELNEIEKQEIANHLLRCETCQRELEILAQIDQAGKEDFFPEPSAKYWPALSGAIMRRIKEQKKPKPAAASFGLWIERLVGTFKLNYRLAGLATAAVILMIIVVAVFYEQGKFKFPSAEKKIVLPAASSKIASAPSESSAAEPLALRATEGAPADDEWLEPKIQALPSSPEESTVLQAEEKELLPVTSDKICSEPIINEANLDRRPEVAAEIQREAPPTADMAGLKASAAETRPLSKEFSKKELTQKSRREKSADQIFQPGTGETKGEVAVYSFDDYKNLAEKSTDRDYRLVLYDSILSREKNPHHRREAIYQKLMLLIEIANEEQTPASIEKAVSVFEENLSLLENHVNFGMLEQQIEKLKTLSGIEKK